MGVLLILGSFIFGYCLLKDFIKPKNSVVTLCGAFITGSLLTGTILYLLDLLFVYTFKNYFLSNIVLMAAVFIYAGFKVKGGILKELKKDFINFFYDRWCFYIFIIFTAFTSWLFYHIFNVSGGVINVVGAYSDVMFHNTISRTVSSGNNIPMQYPFFATGSTMHYHFLYDYFVGKISQIGLNTVHSTNIMSILSFSSLLLLIIKFGETYFKSKATGILGALFLVFHSSISAFSWIKENSGANIFNELINRQGWLGTAQFEGWGLFGIVVFLAQKHLIFTGALLVFLVICFLDNQEDKGKNNLSKNSMKKNIFIGLLIAATPFWNVAVTVACLGILGFMALLRLKNRRLFFGTLYSVLIASLFVVPQLMAFKSGGTVLSGYPKIHFGYALDNFTLAGFAVYYFKVLGIKVFLIIASLLIIPVLKKLDMIAFSIPFILANVLQIGAVLYDNNKLIILSLIFLNCFAAYVVVQFFRKLPKPLVFIPAILVFSMTFAGVIDFFAAKNMNMNPIKDDASEFKQWIVKNTEPDSVFLTNTSLPGDDNAITTVNLSGRLIYGVYNFAASCYDVGPRLEMIKNFYSFNGASNELKDRLEKENIDYIIIDRLVTENKDLGADPNYFEKNFKQVYNKDGIYVYSVN